MQKETVKFEASVFFEGMTSVRAVIKGIESGVNDRRIKHIYYDAKKIDKNRKNIGYLKAVSNIYGFDIVETDAEFLDEISIGSSHGGIIAEAEERTVPSLSPQAILSSSSNAFYAMIQGIEDPYNFGYAIRSLYACGCEGIILGERNWMSAAGVVCRSSAGASEMIPVFKCDELVAATLFKEAGYSLVSADERTENVLGECSLPCPLLLIVGGEKRGISKALLDMTDILVRIPYARDFRASLSAASATTMFAYEIMRQKNINKH